MLARNAVHLLPEGGLEAKLKLGRPLRVKLGIDVTSPDIHVGRAIPLQRMRAFQDAGHVGVLIVGDYTTRIGDPSGRSAERPVLDAEEIDRNAQTYVEQAMLVLDRERTEVRFNGEWLGGLDFAEILRLTRTITVSQILERDDFAQRYAAWPARSRSRSCCTRSCRRTTRLPSRPTSSSAAQISSTTCWQVGRSWSHTASTRRWCSRHLCSSRGTAPR